MKGSKNLLNLFTSAIYRIKNKQDLLPLYGLEIYLGRFGSGKTANCVSRIYDLLEIYPDYHLLTNVHFLRFENLTISKDNYYFVDTEFNFISNLILILNKENYRGLIILIDEVKVFLPFLEELSSSNFKLFFTILSQLRKLGIYILFTSQVWNKVQSSLRQYILQNGIIINCKKLIPGFTLLQYYDMTSVEETSKISLKGKFKRYDYFIHSPELYQSYDTSSLVSSFNFLYKGDKNNESTFIN